MQNKQEYVYVRRLQDGQILDIPASHLAITLARGGFEEVKDIAAVYENSDIEFPINEHPLECPFCGTVQKDLAALVRHKKNHK